MTASDFLAILPLIVIVGWACLLLLVDLFVPQGRKGITALLAAAGLVGALLLVLLRLGGPARLAFQGMVAIDSYSSLLQIVFLVAGLFGISLAYDFLRRQDIERGEYYVLMLFSIAGMMLMAQAADLIVVFLALELLSIPLYVMAGFVRGQQASQEAAMKYFLLGAFASSFVVYGVALIFGAAGSTNLQAIVAALQAGAVDRGLLAVGAGLLLVGLGFKVAAVPFHMWTPDVYQGSPSPVTAFMSVGAKAGGFAALLRIFVSAFPALGPLWAPVVIWIAALTMTWGNVAAIAQSNIKRMLAYSSIAHAGYILMALPAAASPGVALEAVNAAVFYLLAYTITNLGAWGVVVALEKAEGRGLELEDYAGLGVRKPALALAMAIFMLSLTGLPPTVGFIGKFYVFRAVIDAGLIWLALVGVITSLISAYYYLRVLVMMYMREGDPQPRSEGWLNLTVGLTAIGTLVFGLLPGPIFNLVSQAGLFTFLR